MFIKFKSLEISAINFVIKLKGSVHKHDNSFDQKIALLLSLVARGSNPQYSKAVGLKVIHKSFY